MIDNETGATTETSIETASETTEVTSAFMSEFMKEDEELAATGSVAPAPSVIGEQKAEPEEVAPEASDSGEEPPAPEKKMVPLAAVTDERNKRRDVQTEAQQLREANEQLRAELEKLKAPPAQAETEQVQTALGSLPDPFDDPEGYANGVRALTETVHRLENQYATATKARLSIGFQTAINDIGMEATEATYKAAQTDPQALAYIVNHHNPGDAIKEIYHHIQRQNVAAQIPMGMDVNDWILKRAAELQAEKGTPATQEETQSATTTSATRLPPPSLAGARGTAGALRDTPAGSAFNREFGGE